MIRSVPALPIPIPVRTVAGADEAGDLADGLLGVPLDRVHVRARAAVFEHVDERLAVLDCRRHPAARCRLPEAAHAAENALWSPDAVRRLPTGKVSDCASRVEASRNCGYVRRRPAQPAGSENGQTDASDAVVVMRGMVQTPRVRRVLIGMQPAWEPRP